MSSTTADGMEYYFDIEHKGFDLTWGIWHRLPRHEQKIIALQHGLKSIGKFEEFVSLKQAVDDSEYSMVEVTESAKSYPDRDESINPSGSNKEKELATTTGEDNCEEHEEDDDDDDDDDQSENGSDESITDITNIPFEELMLVGGEILVLPADILHIIFSWLPVDTYGIMALVSPHWKYITRTEAVYKRLCERLYLNQSKRRQLHVSRFDGSYRRMLEIRPRVRAAGGCYVMKYSQIKIIERNMWTEIPVGAILKTEYYRYLYFQEDGRVLYALSSSPPKEMFCRLLNVVLCKEDDPAIVWGTFQVQKYNCTITAKQNWHKVRFDTTIVPTSVQGRFAALSIDRHLTSASGCFEDWSHDRVEHKVPDKQFRFIKDARL